MLKWTKQQQLLQQQQQQLQLKQQHLQQLPQQLQFPPLATISNTQHHLHNTRRQQQLHKRYSTVGSPLALNPTAAAQNTMPTMTHVLERRMHRHSLDNQLEPRRQSLGHAANKENFGVYFTPSPFADKSLNAFRDLSNGKSPRRTAATLRRQTLGAVPLHIKRHSLNSPTATPNRFADAFADANDTTPLSRVRFRSGPREETLSSSRMGDVTLDRMLDAIIESARKEVARCTPAVHESDAELEASIHEMEVRTPTHLRRQRVVRRKNVRTTDMRRKTMAASVTSTSTSPPTAPTAAPALIGLTLPNGIPSPDTPLFKHSRSSEAQLLAMRTPPNLMFVVDSAYAASETKVDMQRCSTPTLEETQSIKRCLSFSSASDDDNDDDDDAYYSSAAKRSSVASSNASSTAEHYCSGRTSRTSQNSLKLAPIKGSVDLAIHVEQRQLNVHVIRCRDLQRSNGSTALNAYVKVALIRKRPPMVENIVESSFQRTAVHRHSSRPYFDHRFRFDLGASEAHNESDVACVEERLQLAVWHRDRQLKRSEFLGCMSFPLQTLLQQSINGSYKLQSQACLNSPQPPIPLQQHPAAPLPASASAPASAPALLPSQSLCSAHAHQATPYANVLYAPTMTSTLTRQKSDEDVISIDSMAQAAAGMDQPMVLSKKALHQRDADENLFLRFLELDPPTEQPAASASSTASGGGGGSATIAAPVASGRRLSAAGKAIGRTPFTMTKKLTRTVERGFGFSIVWTHPPRVEKIEPGLSADRAGILPGDYVIFVDKQNVVTMPEADVLNLIRSQGSTLTLEIFRRSGSGGYSGGSGSGLTIGAVPPALSLTTRSQATTLVMNGKAAASARIASAFSDELQSAAASMTLRRTSGVQSATAVPTATAAAAPMMHVRPSTACSGGTTSSMEAAKRRLNLPQVTFSKESIAPITDNRRRLLLQLISREQNFISALHFGMQRFVQPLQERKDLISPNDHRTLFQNIDELLRISEDILEQLCNDDQEPQMNFASRVYLSKTTAICAAYKKYCNGIKRADCVLVNKSRQAGSEFVAFITEPQVPRKRPDLTMFIHRPLQHFREILKLMQLLASNCHVDTEEHKNFGSVIVELQAAYREITVSSGLMEPLGEGRPLLTLQDLESRMVFTKCKPFTLAVQGRQWIFGGDLSRVEGRSVKPYWTLLFSDIIVFAKVSRDRVLFITEEPIPIANIVDSCFHMRKKTTEFRLTVDPNGRLAESPTGYCAPDLTRTPKKNARRKSLLLRAPSLELKAVWQNLLQRQIFLVNAALGSTPLSSPLDSPDVLNTLVPLSDIGIASASIGSIKLPSMDSINLKNSQQQNKRYSNASDQIEMLIDEKCRILNKTGTSKSNALHLANWMKGQLDKQQEQARLAAQQSRENISQEDEHLLYPDSDHDERITYWTRQQLEKRTKELNLAKENGNLKARPNFGGKRLSGVEELSMSDAYSENVSQLSQSHSTTSDSQITVRSSPIVLDKLAVCRHCHKNCQQSAAAAQQQQQHQRPSSTSPTHTGNSGGAGSAAGGSGAGALLCNSLKVQHSQSSPNRCCRLNGSTSRAGSVSSVSSSTITGEPPSEHSSKVVASSSRRETGDTESDVAQLITDDLSQSEATDDSIGGIPSSSSGVDEMRQRRLTDSFSKLRILDERCEARSLEAQQPKQHKEEEAQKPKQVLTNGYCDETKPNADDKPPTKPEPPPRSLRFTLRTATAETTAIADQQVKTTVTITETANRQIVRTADKQQPSAQASTTPTKSPRSTRSHTTQAAKSPAGSGPRTSQFIACNCECTPADFENTTLSPDELEQQTCKLIDSPKQSPKMPRHIAATSPIEDQHKHCRCVCGNQAKSALASASALAARVQDAADDDLSLMLIGLAQLTPTAKLLNMKSPPMAPLPTPTAVSATEASFVPTIAVVPPTPEAVLTMTTTNVWDNSGGVIVSGSASVSITTGTATQLHINNVPRQAVIENIPEDSCDESPLDEEPPYRPMSNALRRYGTMSSLEKLPSDDRMEDGELDELDNDEEDDVDVDDDDDNAADDDDDDDDDDVDDDIDGDGDGDDDDMDDKARADKVDRNVQRALQESEAAGTSQALVGDSAWTSRAGSFVSGKMSFFEESRAFIDKYLGRWNQEQDATTAPAANSETDEQVDECTSGATSGEEVWGTPTSGGDNDDAHLVNSENTYSSPTKSSNSLNDDDDTELMMDELLMAPPMTASTIRGLLPRRRLEPLFEEETESDEEKTQQESEDVKKGETTTNGHYLEDSAGSSSDEDPANEEEEEEYDEEEEDDEEEPTSTEERLQPDLQTTSIGPRPLRNPGITHTLTSLPAAQSTATSATTAATSSTMAPLPAVVLRASSCEYLLERHSAVASPTISSCSSSLHAATATTTTTLASTRTLPPRATMTSTTTTTMSAMRALRPSAAPPPSTTTTTSSVSDSIKSSNAIAGAIGASTTIVRPAKFIPPPPPPRRLLLTQTDLKRNSGAEQPKAPLPPRKSGASADVGSSADVGAGDIGTHAAATSTAKAATSAATATSTATRHSAAAGTAPATKRPSSTIIETSLLGSLVADKRPASTALPTVSTTKAAKQPQQQQQQQQHAKTKPTAAEQRDDIDSTSAAVQPPAGSGLSPRLEMRLALNHDILGDEDLICYDPGPDLTTILGHDLSTFQRLTGRDLLNRSATNRVQPKEAVISFCQQRNSKMDTPTVNRRPRPSGSATTPASLVGLAGSARVGGAPQHLQPNRNTWSSSASAARSAADSARGDDNSKSCNYSSDESKLSDLEILARREKTYCMSQLRSGSQVKTTKTKPTTTTTTTATRSRDSSISPQLTRTRSITSMGGETESGSHKATVAGGGSMRVRKIGRDESAFMEAGKGNRLINFIKRRNSEIPLSPNCSQSSLSESNASGTPVHRQTGQMSPRKDNDKPSLNRRLWKQITKRRRANSVSELVAS